MKKLLLALLILSCFESTALGQLCPGGGTNFSSAVMFDPSWIYGCNTGTSCNGGVSLDNRSACLPITSLDACAPAPSCGVLSQSASNVWFKFFASSTNAVISCFQNTSLVLGIQAFSGGPACGSLIDLGCAISAGPSSGVKLNLANLQVGTLYYFRIFGSSTPISQRTGLYCFCGTTGVNDFLILPITFDQVTAHASGNSVNLNWTVSGNGDVKDFMVEGSTDGSHFSGIGTVERGNVGINATYEYTDRRPRTGINYYRIKYTRNDGYRAYSAVMSATVGASSHCQLRTEGSNLQVTVDKPGRIYILSSTGQLLRIRQVTQGTTTFAMSGVPAGVYFAQWDQTGAIQKFYVAK